MPTNPSEAAKDVALRLADNYLDGSHSNEDVEVLAVIVECALDTARKEGERAGELKGAREAWSRCARLITNSRISIDIMVALQGSRDAHLASIEKEHGGDGSTPSTRPGEVIDVVDGDSVAAESSSSCLCSISVGPAGECPEHGWL